tara:strand:- start:1918 stop:2649 length:732 start_codon:yes stop_codon:yes gene_type:complete
MNLNFETPETLWPHFSKHFPSVSEIIGGHEDPTHIPIKIEFSEFISNDFEDNFSALLDELEEEIETISTYHACKIIDESSYRQGGIRRLNKEAMIKWMKDFFGLDSEVEEAVDALERKMSCSYSERSERSVFTMCSMTHSNQSLSYRDGCEFIRYASDILGKEYHQKYVTYGQPCHIEIRTPLEWFEKNTDDGDLSKLIRALLAHWLLLESDLEHYAEDRMNSSVIFQSDIPSEMIHHFHYKN